MPLTAGPMHPSASIPRTTCAWCDGPAEWWLCADCDALPWSRGGARFIVRRVFYNGTNADRGWYARTIFDRAFCHRPVLAGSISHAPYAIARICRNLNYEARLEQAAYLPRKAAA